MPQDLYLLAVLDGLHRRQTRICGQPQIQLQLYSALVDFYDAQGLSAQDFSFYS